MDSKAGSSRPKTPQDYEMSFTPVTQNRFQLLQDFPALTYSQAACTPISSQIRPIQQLPKIQENPLKILILQNHFISILP